MDFEIAMRRNKQYAREEKGTLDRLSCTERRPGAGRNAVTAKKAA